jgi:hypothetical protein
MNTRRRFLSQIAIAMTAPYVVASRVLAQAPATAPAVKIEETDPLAVALGYKEDGSKVDVQTYPMYQKENRCSGCALYTGKAGEATGPCSAMGSKLVTAEGWCAVFAKKA